MHPAPALLALAATLVPPTEATSGAAAMPAPLEASDGPRVTLPESPAARAFAGVGPDTLPVTLAEALYANDAWLRAPGEAAPDAVYARWGAWLKSEAGAVAIDPRARGGLTLFAVQQRRYEDAWAHFGRLSASPEWAAAVLPQLVPGAPADAAAGPGGLPGALPDGVLLTPAPPPPPAGDPRGSLRPRTAEVKGLRIGAAIVDFRISVEPSGVQVDLEHVGGEAATVRIFLPEPVGQEIRVEYLDWMRQDLVRVPLLVELSPEDPEEHTLWGRFQPRRVPLPALPLGAPPRGFQRGGLFLSVTPDDPVEAEARAFAAALGALFDVPAYVRAAGDRPPIDVVEPIACELPGGPAGRLRLVQLVSSVERHLTRSER